MTPLSAFLIGITTGGLTCLAVQGGLLFGLLARQQTDADTPAWKRLTFPVLAFLATKIIAYTLLGLGLGWLGSKLQLSPTMRIWLQAFAGTVMIISGIKLLWPNFLPWFTFSPPASVRRFIRKRSKSEALVAPGILGLLTILIPCGTTQAMEVAAIATGSAVKGSAIMFAFVLGTAPLFLLIGLLAKGTALFQSKLKFAAAALVVGVGLYTINGVLVLTGSPYSFQNEVASWRTLLSGKSGVAVAQADTAPTIEVSGRGYSPSSITVPAGKNVTINLKKVGSLGCTSVFRIPQLNIERNLLLSDANTIATVFPQPGRYVFTCGMGMYTGVINAV